MVDEPAIKFLADTLGGFFYKEKPRCKNGRPLYCYQASDLSSENILRAVIPYLRVKRQQALTVLALRDLQKQSRNYRTKIVGERKFPNTYGNRVIKTKAHSDAYIQECHELYERCKRLNRVGIGGDATCGK